MTRTHFAAQAAACRDRLVAAAQALIAVPSPNPPGTPAPAPRPPRR
ncbi:hypothetical protein ACFQY5_03015 [Paeniroseomonas aquatica]